MRLSITGRLEKDWFGAACPVSPGYELACESGLLVFRVFADESPRFVAHDTGGFHEGLWEGDCAEVFLKTPGSPHYVEINLSPKGGWWACAFDDRRVRSAEGARPLAGVGTTFSVFPSRWSAGIEIPVTSLPLPTGFSPEALRGDVTFCLGSVPRSHLTRFGPSGEQPDFHRPAEWPALFDG